MGTWGTGSFDNDDALDWVEMFVDAEDGDLEPTDDEAEGDEERAMTKVALVFGPLAMAAGYTDEDEDAEEEEAGELEADVAAQAIVAAELVAAMAGKPSPDFARAAEDVEGDPEEEEDALTGVARWMTSDAAAHPRWCDPYIREVARHAMQRVLEESELAVLWSESDAENSKAWRAGVEDLIARLGDGAAAASGDDE
jgi:hypothetical protein